MNRLSALIVGLSIIAVGCGGESSPTAPSEGTTTTSTFTVPLSSGNEVPAIVNADATGSGTAVIALTVAKDNAGNITSATANFQITVAGFPAGTSITDAHIHNGVVGQQCRCLRQYDARLRRNRARQRRRLDCQEWDQRTVGPGRGDPQQSSGTLLQRSHGAESSRRNSRPAWRPIVTQGTADPYLEQALSPDHTYSFGSGSRARRIVRALGRASIDRAGNRLLKRRGRVVSRSVRLWKRASQLNQARCR